MRILKVMLIINIKAILIIIIFCSCSNINCNETHVREIESNKHRFKSEYKQKKWEYFLGLNNCDKVYFLDSVMRPILSRNIELGKETMNWEINYFVDTLLFSDISSENFYYWTFGEVHRLTNHRPSFSFFVNEFKAGGFVDYDIMPSYRIRDSLEKYNNDIEVWKDSLGCN